MHPVLKLTSLTHDEIIKKFDLKCSKKQLSLARRGYPNYLAIVEPMLAGVDVETLKQAQKQDNEERICSVLIRMASALKRWQQKGVIDISKSIDTYMAAYKHYVDSKVEYNQLGITPRSHEILNKLNTEVRAKHKRIQDAYKRLLDEHTKAQDEHAKALSEMQQTV